MGLEREGNMGKWVCIEEEITYRCDICEDIALAVLLHRLEDNDGNLTRQWEVELVTSCKQCGPVVIITRDVIGDLEGAQGVALEVIECWFDAMADITKGIKERDQQ